MAERRGPKTCLPESRTWSQLAPCGLQPGPLAFSCMSVTLHTGEALVLIHSHANSEKARVCINAVTCNTFLKGFSWASGLSQRHSDSVVGVKCNVQSK